MYLHTMAHQAFLMFYTDPDDLGNLLLRKLIILVTN